ncbi:hypothetical protein, partial [Evtepia gabavorous]|uniref:hypothetical protein n=1 Tax=Evtepia gabavorous TaxID=2211183 RepID=UPI003A8FA771
LKNVSKKDRLRRLYNKGRFSVGQSRRKHKIFLRLFSHPLNRPWIKWEEHRADREGWESEGGLFL